MRQILTSTQISNRFSSASRDAQELLPHLVRRLIRFTVPIESFGRMRIPVGDDIGRPGFDGVVETNGAHGEVPEGLSVWEMGTGNPADKAENDYQRRKKDTQGVDPSRATFVFVTPHRWDGGRQWANEKRPEGLWSDVRVVDNADLAEWLEAAPSVCRWLAGQMGIAVPGLKDLELFQSELAALYGIKVSPELTISGRTPAVEQIHKWIESDSTAVTVEGESPEEAAAFIAACIQKLPSALREWVGSRLLFADDPEAVESLNSTGAIQFVVPLREDARIRAKARAGQLRVIAARGRLIGTGPTESIRLGSIRRKECREALLQIGLPEHRADRIAEESKGSLSAVLWMAATDLQHSPEWTQQEAAHELVPLLLAGEWSAEDTNDRTLIEKLCGRSYDEIERILAKWSSPIGPLVKWGRKWDWRAADFAWRCYALSGVITNDQIHRFIEVSKTVLTAVEIGPEVKPEECWTAAIVGRRHPYSAALRSGLVESIAHLAVDVERLPSGRGQDVANLLVRDLLRDRTSDRVVRWQLLAHWLPDLAEAAPDEFLQALESLIELDNAAEMIFDERGGLFVSSSPHVQFLWALERLAWSKDLFLRVVLLLGRLAHIDPGGQLANRPRATLVSLFLPWLPQTTVGVEVRLKALDLLYREYQEVGWEVTERLFPQEMGIGHLSNSPRWRNWKPSESGAASTQDFWEFTEGLVHRSIEWTGTSGERWKSLISVFARLAIQAPPIASKILAKFESLSPEAFLDRDRILLADSIRATTGWYREHSSATAGVSPDQLDRLDQIGAKLESISSIDRHIWLFEAWPRLIGRRARSFEENSAELQRLRREALQEIWNSGGLATILDFSKRVKSGGAVGFALAELNLSEADEASLLNAVLSAVATKSTTPSELELAWGYIACKQSPKYPMWLNRALRNGGIAWDTQRYLNLALGLFPCSDTWDSLATWNKEVERLYWQRARIMSVVAADVERAVRSLLAAARPYSALWVAEVCRTQPADGVGKQGVRLSRELVVEILRSAGEGDPKDEWHAPETSSLGYHVGRLLDYLEDNNTDDDILVQLEISWLPVLERDERHFKACQRTIAKQPAFFVELLKAIFRGENEEPKNLTERERAIGMRASKLLDAWHLAPGTIELHGAVGGSDGGITFPTGSIDPARLSQWVREARELAEKSGRLGVCDSRIGNMLAYSPRASDDSWPCEPVRDLIENIGSEELERGLSIGVFNKRGVYWGRGGDKERKLRDMFKSFADQVRMGWPRTGALLDRIAENYEVHAKREDEVEALEEFE